MDTLTSIQSQICGFSKTIEVKGQQGASQVLENSPNCWLVCMLVKCSKVEKSRLMRTFVGGGGMTKGSWKAFIYHLLNIHCLLSVCLALSWMLGISSE